MKKRTVNILFSCFEAQHFVVKVNTCFLLSLHFY